MPNLRVQTPVGRNFIFDLEKHETTIGRELKNDLILDDPRVSRLHAIVKKSNLSVVLCDMESGNGTFVNGHRIPPNVEFKLADQDEIKLGSCTLVYNQTDPLKTQFSSDSFREVLQKPPNELLLTSSLKDFNPAQPPSGEFYRRELEKKERILRLFYELSQKLGSAFSLAEIYEKVFAIMFSVTPASRCFIFRKNAQDEFEQVAAQMREAGDIGDPLPISQSIFAKVATERVSILLEDTSHPATMEQAPQSVLVNEIQSVMAAPILGPRGLLGIIYADRHNAIESFNSDDLDVLNAVASIKQLPDVNPEKIGMWGHSMGGYLTLRTMVTSKDVKVGVIWAGVVASYPDLLYNWHRTGSFTPSPSSRGVGWRTQWIEEFGAPEDNPVFWDTVSATSHLSNLSGPLELHHGTADEDVPVEFSIRLAELARAAGKTADLYTYDGDNHNISANFSTAMQRTIAFFDSVLK